jgi:hypothetical protein
MLFACRYGSRISRRVPRSNCLPQCGSVRFARGSAAVRLISTLWSQQRRTWRWTRAAIWSLKMVALTRRGLVNAVVGRRRCWPSSVVIRNARSDVPGLLPCAASPNAICLRTIRLNHFKRVAVNDRRFPRCMSFLVRLQRGSVGRTIAISGLRPWANHATRFYRESTALRGSAVGRMHGRRRKWTSSIASSHSE